MTNLVANVKRYKKFIIGVIADVEIKHHGRPGNDGDGVAKL